MAKNNRLLGVIKEFSVLDLDPETVDNHKMGYIFEDIIKENFFNINFSSI